MASLYTGVSVHRTSVVAGVGVTSVGGVVVANSVAVSVQLGMKGGVVEDGIGDNWSGVKIGDRDGVGVAGRLSVANGVLVPSRLLQGVACPEQPARTKTTVAISTLSFDIILCLDREAASFRHMGLRLSVITLKDCPNICYLLMCQQKLSHPRYGRSSDRSNLGY